MTEKPAPTLRAQWLGQQLLGLRSAAGMKLKEVGEYMQRDGSTISRFETGEYPIRRPDLLALLDFYGLANKRKRDALLRLNDEAWQTGWWDDYADDVDQKFVDYVWLEQRATSILAFDNTAFAGLLQTEDYARAAITAAELGATSGQIERWVDLRMARQALLGQAKPPQILAVVDESLLRREVGNLEVLAEQLVHLIRLCERPNIDVRVLGFAAGAHASPAGPFKIFKMADPYPEVAYVETLAGALYIEPPKTKRFVSAYDALVKAALDAVGSVDVMRAIVEELE